MKATSDGSTTSISDDVSVDVSKDQSDEKENTLASSNRPWVLVSTFLILSTLLQSVSARLVPCHCSLLIYPQVKPSEAYAPFYFRDARHLSKDVINSASTFHSIGVDAGAEGWAGSLSIPNLRDAVWFVAGHVPR